MINNKNTLLPQSLNQGGAAVWGSIGGFLPDQTDLNDILLSKQNLYIINNTILSSSSKDVDSNVKTSTKILKYSCYLTTPYKQRSFDINVNYNGLDVDYSIYNIIGEVLDIVITINISGSNIIFNIQNNETETITYTLFKNIFN